MAYSPESRLVAAPNSALAARRRSAGLSMRFNLDQPAMNMRLTKNVWNQYRAKNGRLGACHERPTTSGNVAI